MGFGQNLFNGVIIEFLSASVKTVDDIETCWRQMQTSIGNMDEVINAYVLRRRLHTVDGGMKVDGVLRSPRAKELLRTTSGQFESSVGPTSVYTNIVYSAFAWYNRPRGAEIPSRAFEASYCPTSICVFPSGAQCAL